MLSLMRTQDQDLRERVMRAAHPYTLTKRHSPLDGRQLVELLRRGLRKTLQKSCPRSRRAYDARSTWSHRMSTDQTPAEPRYLVDGARDLLRVKLMKGYGYKVNIVTSYDNCKPGKGKCRGASLVSEASQRASLTSQVRWKQPSDCCLNRSRRWSPQSKC